MLFTLSPGNTSDIKAGKELLKQHDLPETVTHLVMDRGYSSYETLSLCAKKKVVAVVPPKVSFKRPWPYDKNLYAYRNEIERCFHRLKNFRRIATRYDKLDICYSGFVILGIIALLLRTLC